MSGNDLASSKYVFRPRLLVDFDGVLHNYLAAGGWGNGLVRGEPFPGAIEWLISLIGHYEVAIFSTRCAQLGNRLHVSRWLEHHDIDGRITKALQAGDILFTAEKLPAKLMIDDRCLRFTGAFPSVAELNAYNPWDEEPPAVTAAEMADPLFQRAEQLIAAARSYRRLAEEMVGFDRDDFAAALLDMARQADSLASRIRWAVMPR